MSTWTSERKDRVELTSALVYYRTVEGLMPPEMSEVKVAMERWEVGVGAKGRIVR